MTLTAVQEQMVPGVEAAMKQPLNYHEATLAFQLTLIDRAMKKADGVANQAALMLGVHPSLVARAVKEGRTGSTRWAKKFKTVRAETK